GALSIPNLNMGLADFVKEGDPIPVVQATSGIQTTLEPYKIATIVTLTNELLASSNAEQLVKTALLESTGPAIDRRLFDSNPSVPDLRPGGLLNGITPLTAATNPSGKADAMADDLQALLTAVAPVAGNGQITVIAAPAQSVAIGLRAFTAFSHAVLSSNQLAPGVVIAVANAGIVAAVGEVAIDTTRAASWVADTSPGAILAGGVVHTAFQTDTTGLRLRLPISWAVRDPRAVAWTQGAAW